MVAYSFRKRFVEPIRSGRKRQTIRRNRRAGHHALPGDTLQLYTGLRTRFAKLIARAECTAALPIIIVWHPKIGRHPRTEITVGGEPVPEDKLDEFARGDGFADIADMRAFWIAEHGLGLEPFHGTIIKWGDLL